MEAWEPKFPRILQLHGTVKESSRKNRGRNTKQHPIKGFDLGRPKDSGSLDDIFHGLTGAFPSDGIRDP